MKNKIFTIILILLFLITLTFVSASENDTVLSVAETNDVVTIYNDNLSLQSSVDNEIMEENTGNLLGININSTQINPTLKEMSKTIVVIGNFSQSIDIIEGDHGNFNVTVYGLEVHNPIENVNVSLTADDGVIYAVSNSRGVAYFNLSTIPVGNYSAIVVVDDNNYESDSVTFNLSVKKRKISVHLTNYDLIPPEIIMNLSDNKSFVATVEDMDYNPIGNVSVRLTADDNVIYAVSNSSGKATFNLKDIPIGEYKVNVVVDDENYNSSDIVTFYLSVNGTTISVVRSSEGIIEDNPITLFANLTDKYGKPLVGEEILFYKNGRLSNKLKSDNNGQVSIDIKESSGFYYCYFKFEGNSNYAQSVSDMSELAFANTDDLTDLVVRMLLSDGVLDLTKDYMGYGKNSVVRRNVSDYNQILYSGALNDGILVSTNQIINGNGHIIDVTSSYDHRNFFYIKNAALTLNNISLLNGYTNDLSKPLFACLNDVTVNLNNVLLANYYTPGGQNPRSTFDKPTNWVNLNLKLNAINSIFINNDGYLTPKDNTVSYANFNSCTFINNTVLFWINNWLDVNFRSNLFLNNSQIFYQDSSSSQWESGTVTGNYWGTNDTLVINSIRPTGGEIYINFGDHTYLTIDGNPTFCEDDVQDYDIYFSGPDAYKVPAYKTIISYTSNHSTINATNITITSNPTTVRVSPKTYGLETLLVEPDLYELDINITKSTKLNYNVTVDAPETQYSVPLVITVNVNDVDGNPVTTTANVTIDGTTKTINITDGIGTLSVKDLIPGNYEIITKIISNMSNYRNTTIYSFADITKATAVITLGCNSTDVKARENVSFNIKAQNVAGTNVSLNIYIEEDGVEVGNITTDAAGSGIFYYRPEAGNHTYVAKTHADKYWKSSKSNPVGLHVIEKIPTKLTISSDTEIITDINQKATFNVKLTDGDNAPIAGAEVKLVANDVVVDSTITNGDGKCDFEYTNTSNLYKIKAVYDGNLTYYDNSSEIIELVIATGTNFFDLSILINVTKENGVLNILRDFTLNETLDYGFINGIPINKNIKINGDNNTINALNKSKIFNIKADTVTIDNLNVINAFSKSSGGAIYFEGETLTISNSKFEDNEVILSDGLESKSLIGGGAIYSYGILNIINSTFKDNKIFTYDNFGIEFNGGGAIFARNDLNIYNSIFDANRAGLIRITGDKDASPPYGSSLCIYRGFTEIHNSTFKNGISHSNLVYYANLDGDFSVYNSLFLNNHALNFTGALSIASKDGKIINTTFENNSARENGVLHINSIDGFLISESKFINNSAQSESSVISAVPSNNVIVEKSYFINNHVDNGGTIYYSPFTDFTLRYNIFVNNTANATGVYYDADDDPFSEDKGNLNYDYWGNNTPYDANVFNELVRKNYDYITLEIIGENVTYTTVPTTYIIKFNGTNSDKLPNFDTLIEALADANVNLDKTSITINGSGAKVVLTSDVVQNITLVVGPEYNILAAFNIIVEQLIKKNYTSDITVSGNEYEKTLIVTIEILDEDGKGINGSLTYTFDNKSQNATLLDGKAIIVLGRNYDVGEYNIGFVYNSTDLLYNDVMGNKIFNISKATTKFDLTVSNITYGEDEIITATPESGVEGNFTFYIKDVLNEVVLIKDGKASYNLSGLSCGNYTLVATYNGNKNYNSSSQSRNFTVLKASANMVVDIGESILGQNTTVTVTFNGDVEGNVTITVDGTDYVLPIKSGVVTLNLTDLAEGNHTVNVTYPGNGNYNSCTFNTTFSTKSLTAQIIVTSSDVVYGKDVIVKATVTSDATGEVEFTINNITKTAKINKGVATARFKGLNAGDYIVTARYLGDETYISSTNTTEVIVFKAKSAVLIDVGEIRENENIVITFTVLGNATGNITVEIPGLYSPRNETLTNGVYKWIIVPLSGNYTVKVTYNGDNNYLTSSNSTTFAAKYKPGLDIEISDAFVGDDYTISVILNSTVTGSVLITVDGVEYNKTLKKGRASVTLKNLTAGNHSVDVVYSGDSNFYNATKSKSFAPKSSVSGINVTSSDIVYGSDLIVKASVTPGATGNVTFTVDGKSKTVEIKDGLAETTFTKVNAGTHTVTAKYLGDKEYTSATNTTTVTVGKAKSYVFIDVGEIRDGENVVIKFSVPSDAAGTITVEIPGLYKPRNRTVTDGVNTWIITPLKSGIYTLNAVYNGDKNYLASSNSTILISKAYPTVNIDVGESVVGQDATINVALPANATGSVLITVDGVKYNKTLKNGKASVVISNITKATHKVDVLYSGDKYYYSASNSTSFVPKQLIPTLSVLASDILFGEDLIVRAVVNTDATGTVTFSVNGEDKAVQVHQGFASATFAKLNAGTYDVKALYSGNDVYSSASNSTKGTVSKSDSAILINVGEIKEGQNVQIRFIAPKLATGNITIEIPGLYSPRNRTLTNGEYVWVISPLSAGLYQVLVSYGGDNNYYGSSNSTYIDYNRVKTALNVDAIVTKNNVRLAANLTAENGQLLSAWVNVTVNGTHYRIPVINGTGYLNLGALAGGSYHYYAMYPGTRTIVNSTDEGSFTVIPVIPMMNVPDVVKYYKGPEKLNVYLTDNYNDPIVNKTVVIVINGNEYKRQTDDKGIASLGLGLNSGTYQATVSVDEYSLKTTANVTILATVNGTDVVKVYRNATQYYATFRDSNGNYLAEGTTVSFNINGVFYNRQISGDKGLARLNLNLEQGDYILTAMNPVTGENAANNITIISKIVENKDITKYFRNGTQYTVKILGDDGKPVGAGISVKFNINGVFYERQTNESGIAKLTINLNPGDYVITAEYGGCRVSNNIKVLPVLTAKDLAKKYGTSNPFIATLVDGQGKPYAGQSITFNIHGVFYTRVTDNYGQARLNINLQPGQYIVTSMYGAASISNKVTVTA